MKSAVNTLDLQSHLRRSYPENEWQTVEKVYSDNGIIKLSVMVLNSKGPEISGSNEQSWPIYPAYISIINALLGLTDASEMICKKVADSEIIKIVVNEIKSKKSNPETFRKLLILPFNLVQFSTISIQKLQELNYCELGLGFLNSKLYVTIILK